MNTTFNLTQYLIMSFIVYIHAYMHQIIYNVETYDREKTDKGITHVEAVVLPVCVRMFRQCSKTACKGRV